MKRKNATRRALFTSMLSLLLCVTMFVGTTFAWFTDEVKSGINTIAAGNLDIELEYYDGSDWETVDGATDIFGDSLWEPGYTKVVYLKLSNLGNLALKYALNMNVVSEKTGYNVNDKVFKLSEHIEFGVIDGVNGETAPYTDRTSARDAVAKGIKLSDGYSVSGSMTQQGEDKYMALVVYMPETVGNEANYKTGTAAPEITLGINLFATQLQAESDSFGSDYDAKAPWTGIVGELPAVNENNEMIIMTAEELAAFAQSVNTGNNYEGITVRLGADIDLNNVPWTPIGNNEDGWNNKFDGKFIGTGYTIYNLYVVGESGLGLFGYVGDNAHIEGVHIVNAYVSGTDYVGAVMGSGYLDTNCLKDCIVENATIIATPYLLPNGEYDGGSKAGVIAGYAINGHVIGNEAKNSTVIAYRDLGGIVGMLSGEDHPVMADGNTVDTINLSYATVIGTYAEGKVNENMNAIVGRVNNCEVTNSTGADSVTKDESGATVISTVDDLIAFAADVNAGNTYSKKTVLLGADIDLNNMEWTPIGNSTYAFQGTFDGQNHTISNLNVAMAGKSNAGLFGFTTNGEIKNLTVENASVTGRLNVGVVAGTPYTSKYTNITVKGHVEVNGMSYVGGVGGKNAYANWDKITVNVDETSYVKADSIENGIAYRTYVGGVIGFMGEGGHTISNVTSNIDVIGSTCDVGGIVGIAHYGNSFINCTSSGDVMITDAAEAGDAEEIGGIAGVWMNNTSDVTFIDCEFTGTLTVNFTEGVDLSDNTITGKGYGATTSNNLIIKNYFEVSGVTYYENGVTGDVVLSKISSDAPEKLEIPEYVTVLGSKVLQGNTTVKEVVIPSSVKDFGGTPNAAGTGASGGMFYLSAVEKVVLPEGLTEIPAATFNQASNLKEVNIPDSVKKIGINAFAGSGLSELKIGANVEEIGYGAFRDMDSLTTATIEGDVHIPDYAFRDCSALKDVYLNGVNVTFGSNMIFTITSSNNENPNGIAVHVRNEAIKARLEATGQFKGTIKCMETVNEDGVYEDGNGNTFTYASDEDSLKEALASGADTVYLSAGTYSTLPAGSLKEGVTLECAEGTVFEGTSSLNVNGATVVGATFSNEEGYAVSGTINGTFKNCVFDSSEALRWCYTDEDEAVVFEDCVISTDFRGFHFDTMSGDVTFRNCVINGFNAYGGSGTMTFEGCTFGCDASSYNGLNIYSNTNLINCKFEYTSGKTNFIDMEGTGKTLTITNCTATLDGVEITVTDMVGGSKLAQNTVVVDGVNYTK